jgi:membrane-associated phospholipid phosphatase
MNNGVFGFLKQVKILLVPYLILLIICFVIECLYTKDTIYFTVNGWHTPTGDLLFPYITDMGSGLTCVFITLALLLYNYRMGFLMGTSYAITSIAAQVLKRIFSAPRPILYFHDKIKSLYLVKGVEMFSTNSFPSGHSVSAFSTAVVLAYITPKKYWLVLYFVLAVLTGYSRMYLSEHFFEDVVAGSAFGFFITVFWLSYIDNKPFLRKRGWNRGLLNTGQI